MKKFFRMVMALTLVGGVLAFSGCTDYEDDINALDDRVTALESTVAELQSQIDAGAVITDVTETADGVTVTLSDGTSFNLTNGAAGAPGSVVTIGDDGYWYINGVKQDYPATSAVDQVYYRPNMETGNWDKVTVSPEGEETVEPTQDSWRAEGVTAVWDSVNGTLTFINVEGSEDPIVITFGDFLKSIEFVPEYADGKATATTYYFSTSSDTYSYLAKDAYGYPAVTLSGTYKVTPASYAAKLVENPSAVSMSILPVKTRSAAAELGSVPVRVTEGAQEGYINVEAVLGGSTFVDENGEMNFERFMIALNVSEEVAKEGAVAEDSNDTTTVNTRSSAYVGLVDGSIDVAKAYVLYNANTKKIFGENIDGSSKVEEFEKAWSQAPGKVEFYDGYELALKFNDEFYTIAEAAEIIGCDASLITPVYSGKVNASESSIDASGVPSGETKITDVKKLFTYTKDGLASSIQMAHNAETMQWYVNSYVTVDNTFTVVFDMGYGSADVEVPVLNNTVKYTVVNTSYTLKLAAKVQPWTYEFAVAHSDNPDYDAVDNTNVPTTENAQPLVFSEVAIEEWPSVIDADQIKTILNDTPAGDVKTTVTATLNGRPYTSAPVLNVTNIATELAQIASLEITGYTFSNEGQIVYNFTKEYPIEELDGEKVDANFTVEFQLTMGVKPGKQTVNVPAVEVPFATKAYSAPVEVFETAYNTVNSTNKYFADLDEFTEALNTPTSASHLAERNNEAISDSRLVIGKRTYNNTKKVWEESSAIEFDADAMKSEDDHFTYRTGVTTWFGVPFEFRTEADVVAPTFKLAYAENAVTNGTVTLAGEVDAEADVYNLTLADLKDYFVVTGYDSDAADKNDLRVYFEITTPDSNNGSYVLPTFAADAKKADVGVVPSATTGQGILGASGEENTAVVSYPTSLIVLRTIDVKAVLKLGDAELDTKTLKITTPDPITVADGVINATRTPGQSTVTADLWKALKVYATGYTYNNTGRDNVLGIDVKKGDPINLVNPNYGLDQMFLRGGVEVYTQEVDAEGKPYGEYTKLVGRQDGLDAYNAFIMDYASDKLGFDVKAVSITVDGVETPNVGGITINPSNGTLTCEANNFVGKSVSVKVKFSFKHFLGENVAKDAYVTVNIKDAE